MKVAVRHFLPILGPRIIHTKLCYISLSCKPKRAFVENLFSSSQGEQFPTPASDSIQYCHSGLSLRQHAISWKRVISVGKLVAFPGPMLRDHTVPVQYFNDIIARVQTLYAGRMIILSLLYAIATHVQFIVIAASYKARQVQHQEADKNTLGLCSPYVVRDPFHDIKGQRADTSPAPQPPPKPLRLAL